METSDCSGIKGEQNGGYKCVSTCCQIHVSFSFEDLLLNGNFRDNKLAFTLGTTIALNMTLARVPFMLSA